MSRQTLHTVSDLRTADVAPLGPRMLAENGGRIFTVVRHVSASGMSRVIDAFIMINGESYPLSGISADGTFPMTSMRYDYSRKGFKVNGCGMDMTSHLASNIAHALGLSDNEWSHRDI